MNDQKRRGGNIVKKALATLVILSLLLSAAAMAGAGDVAGTWYAAELIEGENTFIPEDIGVAITLELGADGVARLVSDGEDANTEGKWRLDGDTVTIEGDGTTLALTLADGTLSLDTGVTTIKFTREPPRAGVFAPAAPVKADAEDFAGSWVATHFGMDGEYYSTTLLGTDVSAFIEGTTITMDGDMFSGNPLELVHVDGALTFSDTDEATGAYAAITARLLADGMLMLTMDAGENGAFAFYLERVQ